MDFADLHIHTNASDGLLSPEEVLWWSGRKMLRAISITDHDTISGVIDAMNINIYDDIEIIPGIELNSEYNEEDIHVLGYYINCKDKKFLNRLEEIQKARFTRAKKMIKKLNEMNVEINIEEVLEVSKSNNIGRPHIARILVEKGYVKDMKNAFDLYIGKNRPAYADRYKLKTKDAIEMICEVGGVPVLAHPGLIKNKPDIFNILKEGFKGIEVYHTKHSKKDIKWLLKIAKNNNMLITGGSDCHGALFNNEPILGTIGIDYEGVRLLQKAALS